MGGEPKPMSSSMHRFLAKWTFSESEDDIFIVSILHLNVFFYSLAFWMQQPVLPFLTENLGADSVLFGYLQTFVSILLLIGGPIIGQLTDKLGSKFTLVLCQFGSALAYLTLGLSNSLTMLFISRIITITQQVMQTAQACINTQFQNSSNNSNSNKSTKNGKNNNKNNKNNSANDDESKNIQNRSEEATGRLSMSYGIGMIVGALLGGFIVKQFSLLTNIYISTLVSVIIAVIDIITLPSLTPNTNNNNNKNDQTNKNKSNKKNGNNKNNNDNNDNNKSNNLSSNLYEIFELSMRSNIFTFLVFLFIGTAGVSTYRSMFSLIFKDVFKMEASNIGYYIAYSMSIATLSNSFLIAKLKTYFNNNISVIVEYNCIILAICLFLLGNLCHYTIEYPNSFISNNSIWFLCILAIPQSISSGTLYILANGYIRSKVSTDEMGKAVALTHALRSLNGALSPTVGGHLIGYSYAMIGYFGAITQMISLGILKIYIQPYWKNTN